MTRQDAGTMMNEDFSKYAFVSTKMEYESDSCQDEIRNLSILKKKHCVINLRMIFVMSKNFSDMFRHTESHLHGWYILTAVMCMY